MELEEELESMLGPSTVVPEDTKAAMVLPLHEEISNEIVKICREKRPAALSDTFEIRNAYTSGTISEVDQHTLLFRKFNVVASQRIERAEAIAKDSKSPAGYLAHLVGPSYIIGEELLTGWDALDRRIFRVRVLTAMLSFVTFVMMSATPFINNRDLNINHIMHGGCTHKGHFTGKFNFRSYQLVIAVGVLVWVHNMFFLYYYSLPVDENREKYLPGTNAFWNKCINDRRFVDQTVKWCSWFWNTHAGFLEVLLDGLLLVLGAVAFIVSELIFSASVRCSVDYALPGGMAQQPIRTIQYYTLSTAYETYAHQTPVCLDLSSNPAPTISTALTVLFITLCVMAMCFMNSLAALRRKDEREGEEVESSGAPGAHQDTDHRDGHV